MYVSDYLHFIVIRIICQALPTESTEYKKTFWCVFYFRVGYAPTAAKLIAVDAGHLYQNLYLAAGSIQAGTVAMGAYDQNKMDKALGVDGENEFAIYMAPVGKLA